MEQVFTICFTCFYKHFFLHERFSSEHLVATSTWDWPVSKRNSANSSAHSGRFLGSNSGSSSWMFAWAIGLPVFPAPELGLKAIRRQEVPGLTALFSQSL